MAQHVENDAAAFALAVVPGRALRRLPVALEDPIAELALDREDAAEETAIDEELQLDEAGQEELVLDDAVLHPGVARQAIEGERVGERLGARLLAIDVLALGDRLLE